MFVTKPVFWEYRTFGKDGFWDGKISEDAPQEAKEELEEFLEHEKELKKEGVRI